MTTAPSEISFAWSARSRSGRAVVRLIENATGRRQLIRRANGFAQEIGPARSFFDVMADRYGLDLEIAGGSLAHIPVRGPVIVISNHPFGILDGLMMGRILSSARSDFKLVAHTVFDQTKDLGKHLLPIRFDDAKEARLSNIGTRRNALSFLAQGGAVGIFPGGTVSTSLSPFSRPMDPAWRGFTARMIAKSDAVVLPIYFDGHTSRMFQIASHLHMNLRLGLLINEFRNRVDTSVRVVIGKPIERDVLTPFAADAKGMMDFLRKATYELSPKPLDPAELGFDFEKQTRP